MLLLYYCFKITSSSYLIMYMYFWFFSVYKYIFVNCSYAHFIVHVIVATSIWMFIFLKQQTYLHILIPDYTNCYWWVFLMFHCFNKELYVVYSIFFWIPKKPKSFKSHIVFLPKENWAQFKMSYLINNRHAYRHTSLADYFCFYIFYGTVL